MRSEKRGRGLVIYLVVNSEGGVVSAGGGGSTQRGCAGQPVRNAECFRGFFAEDVYWQQMQHRWRHI
jgi:hypothetical protein